MGHYNLGYFITKFLNLQCIEAKTTSSKNQSVASFHWKTDNVLGLVASCIS